MASVHLFRADNRIAADGNSVEATLIRGGAWRRIDDMMTLRRTGLSPPVYRDQLDYEVIEDGRAIGRIYEDLHALPELRWFWSITVFVGYREGVVTNGRTATLEEAKACFLSNWEKCRPDSTLPRPPSI
jgi:hypothetical protein